MSGWLRPATRWLAAAVLASGALGAARRVAAADESERTPHPQVEARIDAWRDRLDRWGDGWKARIARDWDTRFAAALASAGLPAETSRHRPFDGREIDDVLHLHRDLLAALRAVSGRLGGLPADELARIDKELLANSEALVAKATPLIERRAQQRLAADVAALTVPGAPPPTPSERARRDDEKLAASLRNDGVTRELADLCWDARLFDTPTLWPTGRPHAAYAYYLRVQAFATSQAKLREAMRRELADTLAGREFAHRPTERASFRALTHTPELIASWFDGWPSLAKTRHDLDRAFARGRVAELQGEGTDGPATYHLGTLAVSNLVLGEWNTRLRASGWGLPPGAAPTGGLVRTWMTEAERHRAPAQEGLASSRAALRERFADDAARLAKELAAADDAVRLAEMELYDGQILPRFGAHQQELAGHRERLVATVRAWWANESVWRENRRPGDDAAKVAAADDALLDFYFSEPFRKVANFARAEVFRPVVYQRAPHLPFEGREGRLPFWMILTFDALPPSVPTAIGPISPAAPVADLPEEPTDPKVAEAPPPVAEPPPRLGHKDLQGPGPPTPPQVVATIVVLDQPTRVAAATAGEEPRRSPGVTLCLFGIRLIDALSEGGLTSDLAAARYEVLGTVAGVRALGRDAPLRGLYEQGLAAAVRDLQPSDAALFGVLDAVLVSVTLPHGVLPGLQPFRVGLAQAMWALPHATTTGRVDFIRERPSRRPDEFDRPEEVYVHDRFAVQLETEHELAADEMRLVVLIDGRPLALRSSADASGDGVLVARKVPGAPRLLRTLPIVIVADGPSRVPGDLSAVHLVAVPPGGHLLATTDGAVFEAPALDVASVLLTPDHVRTPDGKGMLVSQAIADAAALDGVKLARLDVGDDTTVETLTSTIVFNWQRHRIELSLLDHAVMLLLKRTFLAAAGERLANLEALAADPILLRAHVPVVTLEMRAAAGAVARGADRSLFPIAYETRVAFPGQSDPLPAVVAFTRPHRSNHAAYAEWRFSATKEVVRRQIVETRRAIGYARRVSDGDVEGLLELTGKGFGPIVERLAPRLLRLQSDPGRQTLSWTPHERARAALTGVANTLNEHETARSAAREDTEALLAVLSSVGMGLGANALGKAVLVIGGAVGAAVAAVDVARADAAADDARFAASAVEILGRDRLELAVREGAGGVMPYLSFALALVGVRLDARDLVGVVRASTARKVAERWMPRVEQEGLRALRDAPLTDKSVLYLLMKEAEDARAAGKTLTPSQAVALRAGAKVEEQLAGAHPWGFPYGDLRHELATKYPGYDDLTVGGRADGPSAVRPAADAAPSAATRKYLPVKDIPAGMPLPGYVVESADGKVRRLVGQPIGRGAYATVYELLDETGAPTDQVIKFLRPEYEETTREFTKRMRDQGMDTRGAFTHAPFDTTPPDELVERVLGSEKLLRAARIPHLPMDDATTALGRLGAASDPPFVIQRALRHDGSEVLIPANGGRLEHGMQVALAKLYRNLADAGLVWKDGHAGNVYFQRAGDGWVAGILDADMVQAWGVPIKNPYVAASVRSTFAVGGGAPGHIGSIRAMTDLLPGGTPLDEAARLADDRLTADILRRVSSSPHEFMAKMLEHKGWIQFERHEADEVARLGRLGTFVGRRLDIDVVLEHFGDVTQWVTYR